MTCTIQSRHNAATYSRMRLEIAEYSLNNRPPHDAGTAKTLSQLMAVRQTGALQRFSENRKVSRQDMLAELARLCTTHTTWVRDHLSHVEYLRDFVMTYRREATS